MSSVFKTLSRLMHRIGRPAHHLLLYRINLSRARRGCHDETAPREDVVQVAAAELIKCLLAVTGLPRMYRSLDRQRNRPYEPDALAQEAVRVFFSCLDVASLPPMSRVILYGSRARGDHRDDSGVDIMLVFAGAEPDDGTDAQVCNAMADAQARANTALAPGPEVTSYCSWADEPDEADDRLNPWFYRNVLADGIDVAYLSASRSGGGR